MLKIEGIMTIVILIGLFLLLGIGCWFLVNSCFLLHDFINHTVFKEKYKNKLIEEINNGIKFNSLKISIYKGEKNNDTFLEEEDYCAICRCCPSEFYLLEGIDNELVEKFKKSELEAEELYEIYSENIRKENLQKRVDFLESEIKDIKKRM